MVVVRSVLGALLAGLLTSACAPTVSRVERNELFERDFRDLHLPDPADVKEAEAWKEMPHVTFDQAWEAVIIVAMQEGLIVRANKRTGLVVAIATAPFVLLVEDREPVRLHFDWLRQYFRYGGQARRIGADEIAENIFGRVATQLYARERWKHLLERTRP